MAKQFDAKISGLCKDRFSSAPSWYKRKLNMTVFAVNRDQAKDEAIDVAKRWYGFIDPTIDHIAEHK